MYKLEFTLKQHTPLIHFQHDQEGATLRASEVKPGLDRYINQSCTAEELPVLESVTTNTKSLSLNYQLKVYPVQTKSHHIPDKFPCFFANMGETEAKEFVYTTQAIVCQIVSTSASLIEIIRRYLPGFFNNTNFGMRKSKGFGSFYLAESDALYKTPEFYYSWFDIDCSGEQSSEAKWQRVFGVIDIFYKSMRSGINETYRRNGIYMKPVIWQYYKEKGVQWEKRKIKQQFNASKLQAQQVQHRNSFEPGNNPVTFNSENYRIIKDMFGLATDEDAWDHHYGFKIKKSHPVMDRMMSPVKFKPLQVSNNKYRVYLDAQKVPDEYFDQSNVFTISKKNRPEQPFPMQAPVDVFDFYDLFDFMLNEIELEAVITNYDERNRTVQTLENVYSQLRENR